METTIRLMKPEEGKTVKHLGLKTFHSMEGLFIHTPKDAVVALQGKQIVGAVLFKICSKDHQSLGYIEYAFVDPHYQGQKIGNALYQAAFEELQKRGCKEISALVKGDNVGSYHLFEKNGFSRCSLLEAYKLLGFKGFVGLLFGTEFFVATGLDLYLTHTKKKQGSLKQILAYLLINLFILLLGYFQNAQSLLYFLLAALTIMGFDLLLSGCLVPFFKRPYHFRINNCGVLVSSIIALLGGFFPLIGRWYPNEMDHSQKLKKELAILSLIEWYGLLALGLCIILWAPLTLYWKYLNSLTVCFVIYKMIPTFPFSEFSSIRIINYSKVTYLLTWLLSALYLFFA